MSREIERQSGPASIYVLGTSRSETLEPNQCHIASSFSTLNVHSRRKEVLQCAFSAGLSGLH